MHRRVFLKSAAIATSSMGMGYMPRFTDKTHTLTLSFDDGFKKSFYKVAEIYEEYGLSACFNVIASGHLPEFQKVDDWILPNLLGNFDDWNALKSRGHEVMPHSWKHLNLTRQPLEKAKELIVQCLDYFEANLQGYKNAEAVFNFPFNASTPALESFALSKVLAIRSREIDDQSNVFRKGCYTYGPKNIDKWLDQRVDEFLKTEGGWLILNVHGLDNEGWGPISEIYLRKLINRLVQIDTLEIAPTASVLMKLMP